jgi:hypothetical protein
MSAHDGAVAQETQVPKQDAKPSSADTSDRENVGLSPWAASGSHHSTGRKLLTTAPVAQDTFEDAVDTAPVRPLTQRKPSLNRPKTGIPPPAAELEDDVSPTTEARETLTPEKKKLQRISQTSVATLDNVNLDDEQTSPPPPVPGRWPDIHTPASVTGSKLLTRV